MPEKLVTRQQLADQFEVTATTIRRWERLGKLAAVKLGRGTVRYRVSDVEKFLAEAGK